jgi:hypothetical protein
MIINSQKTTDVQIIGEQTSKKATLNAEKIAKLSYMLTEGLYTDPISATLVELTNNAMDAVIESGKNPIECPVLVKLFRENTGYKLSIEDRGIGMSQDFFENVFMDMLSSTKEESADQIGHFGIGGKSWASLKKTVSFTIIKDGIKCKYICFKGESFIDYDLVKQEITTEENGVLFELPIADYIEYTDFIRKAKQKLAYYDTVVLSIDGTVWENKIFRNNLFQWSSSQPYNTLHLCLKDVVYTLDFTKLGISTVHQPIALRFGLNDGITPTPNRENIIYNNKSIALIKERLKQVANFFVEKYNETTPVFDSLLKAWPFIDQQTKTVELNGKLFTINNLVNRATVQANTVEVKGLKYLKPIHFYTNTELLMKGFKTGYQELHGSMCKYYFGRGILDSPQNIALIDSSISMAGFFRSWLVEHSGCKYFFRKGGWDRLDSVEIHSLMWQIKGFTVEKEALEEFYTVRDAFIKELFVDGTQWHLSKDFLDYKEQERAKPSYIAKSKKLDKQTGDVTIAYARKHRHGKSWVFDKKTYAVKELHKQPFISVVVTEEESKNIDNLAKWYERQKVSFCLIGKLEIRKIPKLHNFMTLKQLEQSRAFSRLVTAVRAHQAYERFESLKSSNSEVVEACLEKQNELYKEVKKYADKNGVNNFFFGDNLKMVMDTAKVSNLWDPTFIDKVKALEKATEDYDFITVLKKPYRDEDMAGYNKLINSILLFKKMRFAEKYPNLSICVSEPQEELEITHESMGYLN